GVEPHQGTLEPQAPGGVSAAGVTSTPGKERLLSPRSCVQGRSRDGTSRGPPSTASEFHAARSVSALSAEVPLSVRGAPGTRLRAGSAGVRLGDPRRGGVLLPRNEPGRAPERGRCPEPFRGVLEPRDQASADPLRREGLESKPARPRAEDAGGAV